MAGTAAIIAAIGTVVGTGVSAASAAGAFKGSTPKAPTSAAGGVDQAQMARQMMPGTKADMAARGGAGLSPDFYQSLLDQNTGGTGGLDILQEIRRDLGGQAP